MLRVQEANWLDRFLIFLYWISGGADQNAPLKYKAGAPKTHIKAQMVELSRCPMEHFFDKVLQSRENLVIFGPPKKHRRRHHIDARRHQSAQEPKVKNEDFSGLWRNFSGDFGCSRKLDF